MDDCFAVFDSLDSIKILCDSLNEVHPNVKFTTEIQNNKCINFLDVLVDNSSTTVTTSRLHFANRPTLDFIPNGAALYHAAINITWLIACSIVLITSVVLMKAFVQRWIISRLCLVAMAILLIFYIVVSHHEERKNCRTVVARLPFLGDMSMQLKKELSALVEKQTWNRVILRIIDAT